MAFSLSGILICIAQIAMIVLVSIASFEPVTRSMLAFVDIRPKRNVHV